MSIFLERLSEVRCDTLTLEDFVELRGEFNPMEESSLQVRPGDNSFLAHAVANGCVLPLPMCTSQISQQAGGLPCLPLLLSLKIGFRWKQQQR